MLNNYRTLGGSLSLMLGVSLLGAAVSSFAQSENFEGLYEGTATITDFQDMNPAPGDPFDVRIMITQFGNLINFEFQRLFEGAPFGRPLLGEAVATNNAFFGENLTQGGDLRYDTFNGTLNGTTLSGTFEITDLLLEYTVTCESGGCLGGGTPGPEPQDFVFFRGTGGAFGDAGNWDPERVPSGNDTAVFDREIPSPVTVSSASTRRLQFEAGIVMFSGGTLNLNTFELSAGLRSLEVGSNGIAILDMKDHTLNTVHTLLGANMASFASVSLTGLGAVWSNAGRLSVGFDGGINASALSVLDGATLVSSESRIGDLPEGNGRVFVGTSAVTKGGVTFLSSWNTGNLAVGFEGRGRLEIIDGYVASGDSVVIASEANSRGDVTVSGDVPEPNWVIQGSLFVGLEGIGTLRATDLAEVTVGVDVFVAGTPTSCAVVEVVNSSLLLGRFLEIGNGAGQGLLSVLDGGALTWANGVIGSEHGSELIVSGSITAVAGQFLVLGNAPTGNEPQELGTLSVRDGGLAIINEVTVNGGSAIQGVGSVMGTINNQGGILAPGGTDFSIEIDCAFPDPPPQKQNDAFGVLEIDGDLSMTGGALEFLVGGMNSGQFSQLVLTGDATITDPVVHLTFEDGYLPSTGDTAPLVMVVGMLTMTNPTLEFEGIADGFQAEVTNVNGMLMFEALNDAQALAQPPVGCSAGDGAGGASVMFPLLFAGVGLMALRRERKCSSR